MALAAVQVQAMIGAKKAMAFDLTAACSGFVVGLITAAQFIRTGRYRNIVIIGADALSRYVDWRDRGGPLNTFVLTTCHMPENASHVSANHICICLLWVRDKSCLRKGWS